MRWDTQSHMMLTQFSMRNRYRCLFKLKKAIVFLGMMQDNFRQAFIANITDVGMLVYSNINTFMPYLSSQSSLDTGFKGVGMDEISVAGNKPKCTCFSGAGAGTNL